jgi:hypothetical protein
LRIIARGEFRKFLDPSDTQNIDQSEYERRVAETIRKMVRKIRDGDARASVGEVSTKGLEIEVGPKGNYLDTKILNRLDSMQQLGVPVTYDWGRELPMPYSISMRDQLRAVYEMRRCNVIPKDHLMNFHLNFGGCDWHKGIPDAMILRQIIDSANLLNSTCAAPTPPTESDPPGLYVNDGGRRKQLIEDRPSGPSGLPVAIRANGVLETREHGYEENFFKLVKDLSTIGALVEAASASVRLQSGRSTEEIRDTKLANVWGWVRAENMRILKSAGVDEAEYFYDQVERYKEDTFRIERRFAVLRWECVRQAKEKAGFVNEYKKVLIEARKRVRAIERES